jgi:ribonuclease HII
MILRGTDLKHKGEQLLPFLLPDCLEAGCDEAGRGCLAGPVFAAAVILPHTYTHPILNDSKQLTSKQRLLVRDDILRDALAWEVVPVSHEIIDRMNILHASIYAMHLAVQALKVTPDHLLIDGNRFKSYPGIPHDCVIAGDATFLSIAAASVLAKTFRDEFMMEMDVQYPCYGWRRNKGYPTLEHRKAIRQYGLSPIHRKSFNCGNEPTLF